ncbi:helix-turn-helix domain-containing protein [Bradyrhizobium sp. AZCC 1693]|uniref:helix-turn-helix domain-containing protein n=1 Tax=Bradyrhizobium sp. AZCC 1693 TaxID=3117029 RepID=UPI002FF0008F
MPQSHFFPAGEALGDFAEAIWDADFDDARSARALTIKVLPTTSPVLIVHYRAAMTAAHRPRYKRTANGMQTRAMTLRPSGPLGVVLVRLKAEESCRVLGCDLADMTDASVELSDIFGDREASLLEEMLAEAEHAEARVARMRQFLRDRVAANRFDPVVHRAIRALKQDPAVSMKDLASRLDVGERSLQRRFKTLTGISPKQFARVARMEKVIATRLKGNDWADVAYAAGYNDQAHLTNDFRSLVGAPPQAFFRGTLAAERRGWNAQLAVSGFYNTFVT